MSLGKVEAQDPRMLPLLRGGGEEGRRGGGEDPCERILGGERVLILGGKVDE